jgi:hypothetical protein
MSARVVTINEVLGGHVALDIECLDRVCLNAYVPIPAVQRAGGRVHDPAPGHADSLARAVRHG